MNPSDYDKSIEVFVDKLLSLEITNEEIISEVEKYIMHYMKETDQELKRLRMELEYEKGKYQQLRNVFLNQITNRSELETFFFECLGEMRKEILHKGPRGLVSEFGDDKSRHGNNNGIQPPPLDPSRYQALQAVLSNDRILITLFDEIFGPPTKREEFPMLFPKTASKQIRDYNKKAANITSPGNLIIC